MSLRLARYRRPLAAFFAAVGTGLGLLALRPEPPPTVRILAATRDLPGGTTLRDRDLRMVALPPGAVPDGVLRGRGVGHVLAGPIRRGEPITDARLTTGGLLRGHPPGTVATPIRVADPGTARLLRPGDLVDVLTRPTDDALTSARAARPVVSSVPVLAIPRSPGGEGALLVLATDRPQSIALAGAGPSFSIAITQR
jgi:Flp pilus assembly protein CpaB